MKRPGVRHYARAFCWPSILLAIVAAPFVSGCSRGNPLRIGSISSGLSYTTDDYSPITSLPSQALPGAGGSYNDPIYGTKIIRVTDVIDGGDPMNHNSDYAPYCYNDYSLYAPFNMDDTKFVIVCNNYRLLYNFDPSTDTPSYNDTLESGTQVQIDPGAVWSKTNANILYGIGRTPTGGDPKHYLFQIDVSQTGANRFTVIHDFSGDISYANNAAWELDELSVADDEDTFIMTVRAAGSGSGPNDQVFMYKRSANQVTKWTEAMSGFAPHEAFVDKTGQFVTIEPQTSPPYWGIWDTVHNSTDWLQNDDADQMGGHYDNGVDKMYNEGVQSIAGVYARTFGADVHNASPIFQAWTDNSKSTYNWLSVHISDRADNEPWLVLGSYQTTNTAGTAIDYSRALANEIYLIRTDGSHFYRIANTRSTVIDCGDRDSDCYQHQAWPAPSRDGKYVMFHSDMGSGGSGFYGRTDVFIAKVPTDLVPAGGGSCPTGQTMCSGQCVDESSDSNHCGSCTTVCPATSTCTSGACACPAGQTLCSNLNACVDLNTDPAHCGSCTAAACAAGQACVSGVCTSPTTRNLVGDDFNGDGRGDFLTRDSSGNMSVWTSDGTTESDSTQSASYYTDTGGWNTDSHFFAMDFNGDGKTDLLARGYNGGWDVNLSDGTQPVLHHSFQTTLSDANGWNASNRLFPADVNGDGKWDILARQTDGTWEVWLSDGTTLTNSGTFTSYYTDDGGYGTGNSFYMLDVNGDGKTDFIVRGYNGGWDVNISNGSTYSQTTAFTTSYSDANGFRTGNYFFIADINGDHEGDLLARNSDGTFDVWLSDGTTLAYSTSFTSWYTDAGSYGTGNHFMTRDVNGDGMTDLLIRSENGALEEWFSDGTELYSAYGYTTSLTDANGWNDGYRFF